MSMTPDPSGESNEALTSASISTLVLLPDPAEPRCEVCGALRGWHVGGRMPGLVLRDVGDGGLLQCGLAEKPRGKVQ